jgi:hypothetical protein
MRVKGVTYDVGWDQPWAFGEEFIAPPRHYQLPQMQGRAGASLCFYRGAVSEDGDGPLEWCRPVPAGEAEALSACCPELTLRAEPAHQEGFVKLGANGQIGGADWQLVSRSLHAWIEQQHDVRLTDLGSRITYLASEATQGTYSDFAIPFKGQSRG